MAQLDQTGCPSFFMVASLHLNELLNKIKGINLMNRILDQNSNFGSIN